MLSLLAAFVFPVSVTAQTTLRIGKNAMPPLSMEDDNGFLDRMLLEAFRRINRHIEFVILPSERSLSEANVGLLDGDHGRVAGLEKIYPNLLRVPEANMEWEFVAFAVKPGIVLNGWESLRSYHVGYIVGWKILEENVKAASLTKVTTPQQLFSLLKHGRVDLVIFERNGGGFQSREQNITGAYAIEPPLTRQKMFLYLNKKHADIVPALAEAIRDMKTDGTYEAFFPRSDPE
jgi:polar amino acid transport system substrate-binding protein